VTPKHVQAKVFLPPELVRRLDEHALRLRRPKSEIMRAALESFLSPDGPEQLEAALGRRLDRISRQLDRLERDLRIANEAHGLFVRAWLTATPAAPDGPARDAMEAKGQTRYLSFVEALGRRLASGASLVREVLEDREGA
jgi:predicted transcriptional regulator